MRKSHFNLAGNLNSGLSYLITIVLMCDIVTDFDTSLYLESGIPTRKEEKWQTLLGPIGKAECIQKSSRKLIQIKLFM